MAAFFKLTINDQITQAVEKSDENGFCDERHLMHILWSYVNLAPNARRVVFADCNQAIRSGLEKDLNVRRVVAYMHIRDMFDMVREVRTFPSLGTKKGRKR